MNKAYKNISCFITIWNDSKIKNKNPINSFLQLDSIALENFDEEHEQTSDQKFRKRKYWFIYQKKSDADSRLIDCQDNTLTYIWWFNYWKKKNQTNLDACLSDSSEVKTIQMLLRKFHVKSSFIPTNGENDS